MFGLGSHGGGGLKVMKIRGSFIFKGYACHIYQACLGFLPLSLSGKEVCAKDIRELELLSGVGLQQMVSVTF